MAWTDLDLDLIFASDCHLCGGEIRRSHYARLDSAYGWEVDHDIPVSGGGDDDLANLRPAHPSCNRAKGGMASEDFRELLEDAAEDEIAPIALVAAVGIIAGASEPDPSKKLATGLKWAAGTAVVLTVLDALFD